MNISAKKIILDTAAMYVVAAGADVETLDLATISNKTIGTTSGGVEFNAKPIIREVEFDGKLEKKVKGMERITGWEVSATAEAMELIENNITNSLLTKVTGVKYTEYKPKSGILVNEDYQDLLIVGKTSDGKKAVIIIRNTFNMEGLSLKTEDNNEGKLKMTFEGHYDLEEVASVLPFSLYLAV